MISNNCNYQKNVERCSQACEEFLRKNLYLGEGEEFRKSLKKNEVEPYYYKSKRPRSYRFSFM